MCVVRAEVYRVVDEDDEETSLNKQAFTLDTVQGDHVIVTDAPRVAFLNPTP